MIDIKSLRIGSHILVNGKRERVGGIRACKLHNSFQIIIPHESEGIVSFGYIPSASDMIEPIPITPDLLKELGFEERRTEYLYGKPDVWYIDPEAAELEKENSLVVPTITIRSLGRAGYYDLWVIKVVVGGKPMRTGDCIVRYLHEAEAFLALHSVELIKE